MKESKPRYMKKLKPRHLEFFKLYFDKDNKCKQDTYDNVYRSAIGAGFSRPTASHFNLIMPELLRRKIDKKLAKVSETVNIEELVKDLREMKDLFKNPSKVKELREQGLDFKSSDIVKATELLGKYLKMFTDRLQVEGRYTIDNSKEIEVVFDSDQEEKQALQELSASITAKT